MGSFCDALRIKQKTKPRLEHSRGGKEASMNDSTKGVLCAIAFIAVLVLQYLIAVNV